MDAPDPLVLEVLRLAAGDSAEITLDGTLHQLAVTGARLLGARYAAIGVLDDKPGVPRLGTFVHTGMDPATATRLGHPPRGVGLLGDLLLRPEPLRLSDLRTHPTFSGFPEGHPQMRSFLGAPVPVEGAPFGYFYLTDKVDAEEFSEVDAATLTVLAEVAGVRVAQARRYEHEQRRSAWLDATLRISGRLAAGAAEDVLQEITESARRVAHADVAWIRAGRTPDSLAVEAVDVADGAGHLADLPYDATLRALAGRVVEAQEAERAGSASTWWALAVPASTPGGLSGALMLAWDASCGAEFEAVPPPLVVGFAEQVAVALGLAEASRDKGRLDLLTERDRIARDLHDHVIQDLFAATLSLQATARRADDEKVTSRIEEAVEDLQRTSRGIRRAIFGLGAIEHGDDLGAEVVRLVDRAGAQLKLRPDLTVSGRPEELDGPLADDLLAVLVEALSNVTRHAAPGRVDVRLRVGTDQVELVVADDGVGIPDDARRSGLSHLQERAERHGGSASAGPGPDGRGTVVTWRVPRTSGPAGRDPAR